MKIKLLILGYGSIGRRHATNAIKYARVGIYDSSPSTHVDANDICVFSSVQAAFEWKPEAVIIAAPHDSHVSLAKQAIAAGAHVFIEKPISNNLDGTDDLLRLARERNKKIYVACNMRFHPAVSALKTNLPKIGRPLFARAHYGNYLPNMRPGQNYRALYAAQKDCGGVILDGIHEVDYLRWFFGDVEEVVAHSAKLSDLEIDAEDYACLVLKHNSGVRSEIHLDYLQQCKRRGCEIVGEQGTLVWHSEGKQPEKCEVRLFLKGFNDWKTVYSNENEDINNAYDRQMKAFIESLSGAKTSLSTAEDGVAALKIGLLARQFNQEVVS